MITVLGDIAVDIVSQLSTPFRPASDAPAQVRLSHGGSGANVAVWLARLGAPVTFIGRVGSDLFGDWLRHDLVAAGVVPHLVVDPDLRTGVIQVLVEPSGERTMVPDRGANARWRAEELPQDVLASADLLHVVGYVLLDESSQVGALEAMRIARRHGVAISLDPSSHGPLLGRGVEGFLRLAGQVDLLLPNRSEAAVLTAAVTPEDAAEALLCIAGCVAIKLDRDGCLGAVPGERCRVPAPPAPVANATGAGDAFDAGFLRSWVSGRDLVAACRSGVSLGAFAVTLDSTR